ncbi:MAG TPA: hypothetical protein VJ853_00185 [Thermoanaerobaculia bacterium]|nr:hypothetical protein [Thermoanaerobaculia bacterium]
MREKASELGSRIAEEGPEALFDEIENLLPESWRDQIQNFPIAAMVIGVGVGIWLGMRKGEEVIAAATSLATSAAMANVNKAMERFGASE